MKDLHLSRASEVLPKLSHGNKLFCAELVMNSLREENMAETRIL